MTWPQLKTAHDLCAERIVPCSEDTLRALAKTHGIGRKLGRAYVFTPADVVALVEKLPCPSKSSDATARPTGTSAAPSGVSVLTKARALATEKRPRRSGSRGKPTSSGDRSTVIPLSARLQTPR